MDSKSAEINCMAFYHPEGFVPAWKHCQAFIADNGRIATLPDIINARLRTPSEGSDSVPWTTYFTTSSAEYVGVSPRGNRIVIVAHNVGPMSTLDGVLKAYSYEYKDRERTRRG